MALVRWQEIEDMFDRYTRAVGIHRTGGHEPVTTGDCSPPVDIAENDKAFMIKVEIPEVNK